MPTDKTISVSGRKDVDAPKRGAFASRLKFLSAFAQSIFPSMFGGGPIVPREPHAGAWQSGDSRSVPSRQRSPLAHSAVYTCINNISSDLSKLAMHAYRPREKGTGLELHLRHPANAVLRRPNAYQTSMQFFQNYYASKLWRGNAYVLVFRDARGVPSNMHVLNPDEVTPAIAPDGGVWYLVKATHLNRLETDQYIPARNIIHDRMMCLFHPLVGLSPLFAASVSANIGISISDNSNNFFSNMSRASGVLTAPGEIPPTTANRLKSEWDNNYSGYGFGKVAVLGSGLEWKPLTMTAVDAQLIEQLRFTVEDIGRVYRVPYFMLGESKQTYRNAEQSARMYHQGCLSAHIESAEQCFDLAFEVVGGSALRFDLAPLFRLETDLRFEAHQKALTTGIKSINEVRGEEGLPPVTGGEEPRLQMQYVPISMLGKQPESSAQSPAASSPDAGSPAEDSVSDDSGDNEDDSSSDDIDRTAPAATQEDIAAVRLRLLAVASSAVTTTVTE